MLSIEERITVVCGRLRGWTYQWIQKDFNRRYRKPGSNRKTISKLVNKFKRTGNVADVKRSGRPSTSDDTVARIEEAITRSPSASTRRLSRELGIPQSTVWKTLHYRLHMKAYTIQVLHHLEQEDYAAREAMCADLVQAAEEEQLMNNVLFSDEATFHTCGVVNRHNCRIWATEQPHEIREWQRDTPKVNVWLGITKSTVYGPFMFGEPTITGNSYLDMLQQFLEPQLVANGILDTVVYQQDGAPAHFALIVRDYLNATFPGRWIGRGSTRLWASRSPDLTPLDFFVWGFVKSQVYRVKIRDVDQLKRRIRDAVRLITPDILERVFRHSVQRWEMCRDMRGGHVEMR